jgi:hypothetical protein
MESYLVLYFRPFSKKRKVGKFEVETLDDAKKLAQNRKKQNYDVLIIKKSINIVKDYNSIEVKDNEIYEIVKFGYYKVYNVLNILFVVISFIILVFFIYLYYKFFNNH